MKAFVFLSSAFVASGAAISGKLAVTYGGDDSNGFIVSIKGALTNLPNSATNAGIHVHTGEDCTNGGATTTDAVNAHIGGHLFSNNVDPWAYPTPTTYNTDANGNSLIDVSAQYFVLAKTTGTLAMPAVEERCIVLHGASGSDLSSRVAVGQIVKNGDVYEASIGKYPGPNALTTIPNGTLTVTLTENMVTLKGNLQGLGKSLVNAGIHIHEGTDCSGGSDKTTKAAVNAVIKGHLCSKGDGFLTTKYSSNVQGAGTIDIKMPANSYTLLNSAKTEKAPAVENHCIVIHDQGGARVGIGQIKCTSGTCEAAMGAYPTPNPATTPISVATVQTFTTLSAFIFPVVLAF